MADLALSQAARDVLAERARQISEEGWTPEHDDEHGDDNLIHAAVAYALASICDRTDSRLSAIARKWWPWSFRWWKPKDRRRDLVRATALLIAEIERLDRSEARNV
jgi:hypothetical protein